MAKPKTDNQVTGNIGLYYACYRLAKLGWNVMPTARNAKGIDALAYNADASRKLTFQVKSLSKKNATPLGNTLDGLLADFLLICVGVREEVPEIFVLSSQEARGIVSKREKIESSGKKTVSYWIQPKDYYVSDYRDHWKDIGSGLVAGEAAS